MEIKFRFIGWCNTDNHDKIWCSFSLNNVLYCAWGRRGNKLSFKKHNSTYDLIKVSISKESKYNAVDQFLLFSIFPDFEEKVQQDLLMTTLADRVM